MEESERGPTRCTVSTVISCLWMAASRSVRQHNCSRLSPDRARMIMGRPFMDCRLSNMHRSAFILPLCALAYCVSVLAQQPRIVSSPAIPSGTAAGTSFAPPLSADGRYVMFASHAKDLTTNRFSGFGLNLFRRYLLTGETVLISADLSGNGGGDDDSPFFSIS